MFETYREYVYKRAEQRKLREDGYAAITYVDHTNDGQTIEGSEDFSIERWSSAVVCRAVYRPTGKLDKGGHRTWEHTRNVYSRSVKECGKIARIVFSGLEISIRKY